MNRRKKNRIGMRIFAVLMFIAVSCIGIEPEPTRPDAFSNTKETKQQIGKAVPDLEAGAVEETAASDAEHRRKRFRIRFLMRYFWEIPGQKGL